MHKLLQHEFVSRADCKKILDQVSGLSRRETQALSGHLNKIFDHADSLPYSVTRGIFMHEAGGKEVPVRFKRASGGNPACSISSTTLFMLAPSLAEDKAPAPKPAEHHGPLAYVSIPLKAKDELGAEWKTLNDLPALLHDEAKRVGRNSPFSKYSRIHIGQLTSAFAGETGTAHGIECRKYKSHGRMTVAIHEDSIPQLFEHLEQCMHVNGHRSVQARLNNQCTSFER